MNRSGWRRGATLVLLSFCVMSAGPTLAGKGDRLTAWCVEHEECEPARHEAARGEDQPAPPVEQSIAPERRYTLGDLLIWAFAFAAGLIVRSLFIKPPPNLGKIRTDVTSIFHRRISQAHLHAQPTTATLLNDAHTEVLTAIR